MAVSLPVSKVGQCTPQRRGQVMWYGLHPHPPSQSSNYSEVCTLLPGTFWSLKVTNNVLPRFCHPKWLQAAQWSSAASWWCWGCGWRSCSRFPKAVTGRSRRVLADHPKAGPLEATKLRDHSTQWCSCSGWRGLVLPLSLYWLQRATLLLLLPRRVQAVCSSSLPTKK